MANPKLETVESVVARLGAPPPDVAKRWIADARLHFDAREIPDFDAGSTVWQRMVVNEFGQAVLQPDSHSPEREHDQETPAQTSPRSGEGTDQLPGLETSQLDSPLECSATSIEFDPGKSGLVNDRRRVTQSRHRRSTRSFVVAVVIASVALITILFVSRTTPPANENIAEVAQTTPTRRNDPFSPDPINDPDALLPTTPTDRRSSSLSKLETTMEAPDRPESVDVNAESVIINSEESIDLDRLPASLSLDSFLPAEMTEVDERSASATDDVKIASIDITDANDDDETIDEAVPQVTTATVPPQQKTTAMTLPSPPPKLDSVLPSVVEVLTVTSPPTQLHLDFPTDIDLQLQVEQNTWNVTAGDQAVPIAVFEMKRDAGGDRVLQFRWLAAAAETSLAGSLVHGRITTSDGDVVYLRPRLDALAIQTDLSERDEKLKWMLGGPILNAPAGLHLKLRVPDDVSVQWIEPIDENSPQRTRGIAVLTLKDAADSGALAARIDVRGAGTLSMRLRYGGRLGSGMPWRWTDAKSIRAALDATTRQLQVADDQLLQLETAISRAGKLRARRQEVALEIQRDSLEEAVRSGAFIAKRLAKLDQLVALLTADGQIQLTLEVLWPDGSVQTLLSVSARQ